MDDLRAELGPVSFWKRPAAQVELKAGIVDFLDICVRLPFERQELTEDRIVELAKANQGKLTDE